MSPARVLKFGRGQRVHFTRDKRFGYAHIGRKEWWLSDIRSGRVIKLPSRARVLSTIQATRLFDLIYTPFKRVRGR